MIGGNVQGTDGMRVPEAAVSHDALSAANHKPRDEDVASACRSCVTPAVHDKDVTRRTGLDRVTLRMSRVLELRKLVPVLARGHVAQRKGGADHVAALWGHRGDTLDDLPPQAPLVERGGQRRHRYVPEPFDRIS